MVKKKFTEANRRNPEIGRRRGWLCASETRFCGPENLTVEEVADDGFEEAAEHQVNEPQVNLESLFQTQTQANPGHQADDEDDGLECDCGYGPHRTDLKVADDNVNVSIGEGSGC